MISSGIIELGRYNERLKEDNVALRHERTTLERELARLKQGLRHPRGMDLHIVCEVTSAAKSIRNVAIVSEHELRHTQGGSVVLLKHVVEQCAHDLVAEVTGVDPRNWK